MKRNKRSPAAQAYFRAFYEKNRLHFAIGMTFTVLTLGVNFTMSWVLGAVISAVAYRRGGWRKALDQPL